MGLQTRGRGRSAGPRRTGPWDGPRGEERRAPGPRPPERDRKNHSHSVREPESRQIGEHTSELQSPCNLVCRLLLEKKKNNKLLSPSSAPAAPWRVRHPSPARCPSRTRHEERR